MRLILRFFAIVTGLLALQTIASLFSLAANGALGNAAGSGMLGVATVAGWLIVVFVGPFAAAFLWQLRTIGLYLTAFLSALAAAYSLASYLSGGPEGGAALVRAVINAATLAILLSPPARRVCQ